MLQPNDTRLLAEARFEASLKLEKLWRATAIQRAAPILPKNQKNKYMAHADKEVQKFMLFSQYPEYFQYLSPDDQRAMLPNYPQFQPYARKDIQKEFLKTSEEGL